MGNPRNRARKLSRKRKATKCNGVDEKRAKITDEETQQTNAEVRPTTSTIAETPLTTNLAERTSSSSNKLQKRIGDYAEDVEQVEGDGIVMFCIGVMTNMFPRMQARRSWGAF